MLVRKDKKENGGNEERKKSETVSIQYNSPTNTNYRNRDTVFHHCLVPVPISYNASSKCL